VLLDAWTPGAAAAANDGAATDAPRTTVATSSLDTLLLRTTAPALELSSPLPLSVASSSPVKDP